MNCYLKASDSDKEEVIGLLNLVFSLEGNAVDYKKILPKVYSDEINGLGADHFIVRENGLIRGVAALQIVDMDFGGNNLRVGIIGSVAVHPDSRGNEYGRWLVNYAMEEARRESVHLLLFNGERQRVSFFGFENAGEEYAFHLSPANVQFAMKDIDASSITYHFLTEERIDEIRFVCELNRQKLCHVTRSEEELLRIMSNRGENCRIIYKNEERIGYCYGAFKELVLKDESAYPEVIKALFPDGGSVVIPAGFYEQRKIEFLSSVCEDYTLRHNAKVCVLNWKEVLRALLSFQTQRTVLRNGKKRFRIKDEDECLEIQVKGNRVSVKNAKPNRKTQTFLHNEAERAFFGLDGLLSDPKCNWFPLPFYIDSADTL